MGWLRLYKYSLFCRALLRKRPINLRSLLIVATPYLIYIHAFDSYGVATVSRLLKFTGLFCRM